MKFEDMKKAELEAKKRKTKCPNCNKEVDTINILASKSLNQNDSKKLPRRADGMAPRGVQLIGCSKCFNVFFEPEY